jgi:hypothetical protein
VLLHATNSTTTFRDAAGGLLGNLRKSGANPGDHFWITDRRDLATSSWAEANGIQAIRYDNAPGHEVVFREIATDLQNFVSADTPAPPVLASKSGISAALPPPDELARQNPETIRRHLSARATDILRSPDDCAFRTYDQMRRDYARAIHNAYYFSPDPPDNILFCRHRRLHGRRCAWREHSARCRRSMAR